MIDNDCFVPGVPGSRNDEETLVEEGVSRYGLHRRHVIRWGQAVSNAWVEEVAGHEIEAVVRYEEEGIGLHHLRVYWREHSQDD